jgi:TRAP-type C4-dicarboxylate transport system permease small subunit
MIAITRLLSRAIMVIASLLVAIMVASAALGVIFRYALGRALPWAEEFGVYLFIWMIFLGSAVEVLRGEHPAITFVVDRMPAWAAQLSKVIAALAVAAWGLCLLYNGLDALSLESEETWASVPQLSMWWPFLAIPVGGALIAFFALARLVPQK